MSNVGMCGVCGGVEVEMRTQDKFRELNMTFEKNEIWIKTWGKSEDL